MASGVADDLRKLALRYHHFKRPRLSQAATTRTIRVLADVSTYLPATGGGAEQSLHATLTWLRDRGHETCVLTRDNGRSYTFEGVDVHVYQGRHFERTMYSWCDVVLSQGTLARRSRVRAAASAKPFVLFIRGLGDWRKLPAPPDLAVFNSEWQRHAFDYTGPSVVVHPPVDPARYLTKPGNRVTLINLSYKKGGDLFTELVHRLPEIQFLGVAGVWGEQLIPKPLPANLRVVPPQDDVRRVYSETRILLLPSRWESFGRVALEAALSGIPVIATPNPGTLEVLGAAAIYARLSDLDAWTAAITQLEDPDVFAYHSATVAQAAREFVSKDGLVRFDDALRRLVSSP